LVILAPVFLLLADWAMTSAAAQGVRKLGPLLYACYALPLLGPLSIWTHVQFSVLAMATLLGTISRCARRSTHGFDPHTGQ
jgi:hypothetical protein